MPLHLRALVALCSSVWLFAGCAGQNRDDEFVGLGKAGASSEPQPGIFNRVEPGDLEALRERGKLLYDMERTTTMAYEQGAFSVGVGEGAVILPLVDVDPGGHSSQVLFVRWPRDVVQKGALKPEDAQRWLMVSTLLAPDRVLDVELLGSPLEANSTEGRRIEELLMAARHLRELTPDESYHLFSVAERLPEKNEAGTRAQTRVYAMSSDGDGPDIELLVVRPKKSKPPRLLKAMRLHPQGARSADPIDVAAPFPVAATVARVLLRGPEVGEVDAVTEGGTFRISSRNGRVERVSGAANRP